MTYFTYRNPHLLLLVYMPMIIFLAADIIMNELRLHGVEISGGAEDVICHVSLGIGALLGIILMIIFIKKDKQHYNNKWELFEAVFYIASAVLILLLSRLDTNIEAEYLDLIRKTKPI